MKVNFKKLDERAIIPTYGTDKAAGMDLYACLPENIPAFISPGKNTKIGTGIAIEIPDGYFGAIFARSGLATKSALRPANCVGVIDSDYRGELIVALHNDSNKITRQVQHGERIAQLVLIPYVTAELIEVNNLEDTDRGDGGFGSTGK